MKPGSATAPALPAGSDKRRSRRARRRLMVRYASNGIERTGFTKDISETGIFLQTNQVSRPGTTLEIHIHFPGRTVSLWGKVMWAKRVPPQLAHLLQCGMGIQFLDLPPGWGSFLESWKAQAGVV